MIASVSQLTTNSQIKSNFNTLSPNKTVNYKKKKNTAISFKGNYSPDPFHILISTVMKVGTELYKVNKGKENIGAINAINKVIDNPKNYDDSVKEKIFGKIFNIRDVEFSEKLFLKGKRKEVKSIRDAAAQSEKLIRSLGDSNFGDINTVQIPQDFFTLRLLIDGEADIPFNSTKWGVPSLGRTQKGEGTFGMIYHGKFKQDHTVNIMNSTQYFNALLRKNNGDAKAAELARKTASINAGDMLIEENRYKLWGEDDEAFGAYDPFLSKNKNIFIDLFKEGMERSNSDGYKSKLKNNVQYLNDNY